MALVASLLLPAVALAQTGTIAEGSLRQMASRTVMPICVSDWARSLERGVGVVIGQVEFDGRGRVTQVSILEAPSPAIREAVIKALKQWEFRPIAGGEPLSRLTGRVTFYLLTTDGDVVARNPEDVGYIGRWPDRPAIP